MSEGFPGGSMVENLLYSPWGHKRIGMTFPLSRHTETQSSTTLRKMTYFLVISERLVSKK